MEDKFKELCRRNKKKMKKRLEKPVFKTVRWKKGSKANVPKGIKTLKNLI